MKNFPDEFPIRYAIVADDFLRQPEDKAFLADKEHFAFSELLDFLQKVPLTPENTMVNYFNLAKSKSQQWVPSLLRIGKTDENWIRRGWKAFEDLYDAVPATKSGNAYHLQLYSYKGALEVPWFWYWYKHRKSPEMVYLRGKGYTDLIWELSYENYKAMMDGKINDSTFRQIRSEYGESATINAPYSPLWQELDENPKLEGTTLFTQYGDLKLTPIKEQGKITVTVCQTLDGLLLDEMRALYHNARLCRNCGRALSWDFTGSYCGNADCNKDRARKRKRKSSQARG